MKTYCAEHDFMLPLKWMSVSEKDCVQYKQHALRHMTDE